jgi:hypothetical protein
MFYIASGMCGFCQFDLINYVMYYFSVRFSSLIGRSLFLFIRRESFPLSNGDR